MTDVRISPRLHIFFDKLKDWEIKQLIEACEGELELRLQQEMKDFTEEGKTEQS